jgi:hypothetical protein
MLEEALLGNTKYSEEDEVIFRRTRQIGTSWTRNSSYHIIVGTLQFAANHNLLISITAAY